MQPVWQKAVDALKTATRICVIGYSMPETDAFFKFLLALGLAENDRLYKLVVVDLAHRIHAGTNTPERASSKPIEDKWRELLERVFADRRFYFHEVGMANFVRTMLCAELNRGEQVG
jgi:hypothetical protein